VHERPPTIPPALGETEAGRALRAQILATEHWSLLATRSLTYTEVFSRAGIFLTVVSATVVALALVAQATEFGDGFYAFALLILPVVLVLGLGTHVRISHANVEDTWLVLGMNRLRHAYLELAPELEPYFVTGRYDDEDSVLRSYGPEASIRPSRVLASTPVLIGVVDAVVAGVLAGLVARVSDADSLTSVVLGACVAAIVLLVLLAAVRRVIMRARTILVPRFPRPREPEAGAAPGAATS
jgi:hypothetical protein